MLADLIMKLRPKREPDFLIGPEGDPYMRRWWIIPRNKFFNIYLHHMRHDDDDRAPHDHPWWSLSLCLDGHIREIQRIQAEVYTKNGKKIKNFRLSRDRKVYEGEIGKNNTTIRWERDTGEPMHVGPFTKLFEPLSLDMERFVPAHDVENNITKGVWKYRSSEYVHRLEIPDGSAWTLFITGPVSRVLGFWCRKGFVKWNDFVDPNDKGKPGRGCGEMD